MEPILSCFEKAIEKAGSRIRLAGALKTTPGNLTRIMLGAGYPGDEVVIRLALFLEEDPEELLLLNSMERATGPAKDYWMAIVAKYCLKPVTIILVFLFLIAVSTSTADAEVPPLLSNAAENIYYVKLYPPPDRQAVALFWL